MIMMLVIPCVGVYPRKIFVFDLSTTWLPVSVFVLIDLYLFRIEETQGHYALQIKAVCMSQTVLGTTVR